MVLRGGDAVTLFFVLSGFLVTYLLLAENAQKGQINVRWFYVRRILRIWPLYYLLVVLGFFALPLLEWVTGFKGYFPLLQNSLPKYAVKLTEYLFILPHIGAYFGSFVTGIGQLWSIGIEEQFYLMWPPLFRRFSRNLVRFLIVFILAKMGLALLSMWIAPMDFIPQAFKTILGLIVFFRIENMAIGALGACILFYRRDLIARWIFHPAVQIVTLLILLGNIFVFNGLDNAVVTFGLSIVYLIFIINVSCNPKSFIKLENAFFGSLGRISYGIYMYHVLVIYLIIMVFRTPRTSVHKQFCR